MRSKLRCLAKRSVDRKISAFFLSTFRLNSRMLKLHSSTFARNYLMASNCLKSLVISFPGFLIGDNGICNKFPSAGLSRCFY